MSKTGANTQYGVFGSYNSSSSNGYNGVEAIYAFSAIMNIDSIRILAEAVGDDRNEISLLFANSSGVQSYVFNLNDSPVVHLDTLIVGDWSNIIDLKAVVGGETSNPTGTSGGVIYDLKIYGH